MYTLVFSHTQVFGYHHPRTQRCRNCLEEPIYRRIQQARDAKAKKASNKDDNYNAEDREYVEDSESDPDSDY